MDPFDAGWLSLLPPIIAITLALITKEVISSLFLGILSGTVIYCLGMGTGDLIIKPVEIAFTTMVNKVDFNIIIFCTLLGALVFTISRAGGTRAYGNWATKRIKSKRVAMLSTGGLGAFIFIDDYFNCLTVGTVMRPVTDKYSISRAKLAYIIDATAAPVCIIAPISSWAAAVSGIVDESVMSGTELFVRAIPWNYYSLFTLVFVVGLSLMQFDYGPMKLHEMNARLNGDLFTSGERRSDEADIAASPKGRVVDLVLPVLVLIACCVTGMLYVGGFFSGTSFAAAFAGTDASVGLPWGTLIALVFTVIYYICRGLLSFKEAMECTTKGFIAMVPALLILTFAVTLKNMTGMLGAAEYVFGVMQGASRSLYNLLPAIIFLVGCGLAFSTGTSWGTFGILIPIVTDVFPADSQLLIIGVSACLAGAVMGDHCSPISDTTIMASAGAQCDHLNHVSTQIPYVLTVAAISFVSYVIAGFVQNVYICLAIGVALTVATLFVLRAATSRRETVNA